MTDLRTIIPIHRRDVPEIGFWMAIILGDEGDEPEDGALGTECMTGQIAIVDTA